MSALTRIYQIEPQSIRTNHHIHPLNRDSQTGHIAIESIGNDPQIYLPTIHFKPDRTYIMEIEAESASDGWHLYYVSEEGQLIEYSVEFNGGRARFTLPEGLPPQSLRLDPGSDPGIIKLKYAEIYEIAPSQASAATEVDITPPNLAETPGADLGTTLVFLKTHILTPQIANEYNKIRKSGVRTILFVENSKEVFPVINDLPQGKCRLYGVEIEYFLCRPEMYADLGLPFLSDVPAWGWERVMWWNCDYPLYVIRKYYPDYQYYWQTEYDIYLNAPDYRRFLINYASFTDDLIIDRLGIMPENWVTFKNHQWAYPEGKKYCCLYPMERLSGKAIDFLLRRRLEAFVNYTEAHSLNPNTTRWPHCEPFTVNELIRAGFSCVHLKAGSNTIAFDWISPEHPFYAQKLYLEYNGVLYHPIKSAPFLKEAPGVEVLL